MSRGVNCQQNSWLYYTNYSNIQFNYTDKQLPNFARISSGEFLYGNEANYAFPVCLCSHIIRCESDAAECIEWIKYIGCDSVRMPLLCVLRARVQDRVQAQGELVHQKLQNTVPYWQLYATLYVAASREGETISGSERGEEKELLAGLSPRLISLSRSIKTYHNEASIQSALNACDDNTTFEEAWSIMKSRFKYLLRFYGGVANVFPGTSQVEKVTFLL